MSINDLIQANSTATYWGNPLGDYIMAAVVFVSLIIVFKLVQVFLLARLDAFSRSTKSDIDDQFIKIIKSINPPVYMVLSFFISLKTLEFATTIEQVLDGLLFAVIIYQAVKSISILTDYIARKFVKHDTNEAEESAIELLTKISKGILWLLGLLLVLQNVGVNVTSLVAGLGVGGIAIGFALQNILGDLFSSFAIIFDKPFEPGDFIIIGDDMGEVEKIGIKTTRIRALQGEEIVISNQELTSSRIQNFKKMEKRRVTFKIGLEYDTNNDDINKTNSAIEKIIEQQDLTEFDRSHFMEFGDSALVIEVVYYLLSDDYNEFMDIHQKILLDIKEHLETENIDIAFPTQTVLISKN